MSLSTMSSRYWSSATCVTLWRCCSYSALDTRSQYDRVPARFYNHTIWQSTSSLLQSHVTQYQLASTITHVTEYQLAFTITRHRVPARFYNHTSRQSTSSLLQSHVTEYQLASTITRHRVPARFYNHTRHRVPARFWNVIWSDTFSSTESDVLVSQHLLQGS